MLTVHVFEFPTNMKLLRKSRLKIKKSVWESINTQKLVSNVILSYLLTNSNVTFFYFFWLGILHLTFYKQEHWLHLTSNPEILRPQLE